MVYSCGFCTKCFTPKKYLQRHLWKFHKIVQSVNSKYCDKTISEPNLQDHINCHHANKLYVCTICQRSFTNKRNCGLHKRKVRLVQYCFFNLAVKYTVYFFCKLNRQIYLPLFGTSALASQVHVFNRFISAISFSILRAR